tara:strand:+ start:1714 stop:2091 length:378 start_codon:yes stop_codon:yes gene_type:complete
MHMVYTFGPAPAVLAFVPITCEDRLAVEGRSAPVGGRHSITKSDNRRNEEVKPFGMHNFVTFVNHLSLVRYQKQQRSLHRNDGKGPKTNVEQQGPFRKNRVAYHPYSSPDFQLLHQSNQATTSAA